MVLVYSQVGYKRGHSQTNTLSHIKASHSGQEQPPHTHLHWTCYMCRRDPNPMCPTHISLHVTYTGRKVRFQCLDSLCSHEATRSVPAYSDLLEIQKTGVVTARCRRVDSHALKHMKISVTYRGDNFLPCVLAKEQNGKRKVDSPIVKMQSSCGYSNVSCLYILSSLKDYNVMHAIHSTKFICR